MDSNIKGVPVVLIVLVAVIAIIILTPVFFLHASVMGELRSARQDIQTVQISEVHQSKMLNSLIPSPTATPSVSLTPTRTPTPTKRVSPTATPVETTGQER